MTESSSAAQALVRVGLHGQIGRFQLTTSVTLNRRDRVVCRTARGLEVGTVVQPSSSGQASQGPTDGRILRKLRPEDELLWGHLQQLSHEAHQECVQWLHAQARPTSLLDVEPLLDGKTLYFHFLEPVRAETQEFVDHLVDIYERQVAESEFGQLLEQGCGPGCGTEQAVNGCSTQGGGCAVCKVASHCKR